MKILLIKFRNIGDVLLSTPLVENLKINYPDSKIDYALNSNCSEMIKLSPFVENIFEYHRAKVKNKNFFSRIIAESRYIYNIINNNYDIIINLTEGDRGSLITFLNKAKIKLGYKPRKGIFKFIKIYTKLGNENQKIHSVEKDLQFLKLLNKNVRNKKVSIYWSKKDEKKIDTILNKYNISTFVHVHPVSRWMFKCWEDDRMAKMIDYIENIENIKVIITASNEQKEKERIIKILNLCKSKPLNLTGQLSLKELAYLSSKANLFFGIDSAPMHIAAAVNIRVIALFGASSADKWGPWDNDKMKNTYLHNNGLQSMGKHKVICNTDSTIYFENGLKKCKGMVKISFNEVKKYIGIDK